MRNSCFIILLLALSACSVQRDNPNFVYPESSTNKNSVWPKLGPTEDLVAKTAPMGPEVSAPDQELTARATRLKNRSIAPNAVQSLSSRVARLRAKAAALRSASF